MEPMEKAFCENSNTRQPKIKTKSEPLLSNPQFQLTSSYSNQLPQAYQKLVEYVNVSSKNSNKIQKSHASREQADRHVRNSSFVRLITPRPQALIKADDIAHANRNSGSNQDDVVAQSSNTSKAVVLVAEQNDNTGKGLNFATSKSLPKHVTDNKESSPCKESEEDNSKSAIVVTLKQSPELQWKKLNTLDKDLSSPLYKKRNDSMPAGSGFNSGDNVNFTGTTQPSTENEAENINFEIKEVDNMLEKSNENSIHIDLADAIHIRDVDAKVDLARGINPEIDTFRMRHLFLNTFRSEAENDVTLNIPTTVEGLRDLCQAQHAKLKLSNQLFSTLKKEYISMCKKIETTQQDHFKLETLLRKTIAESSRNVENLKEEKRMQSDMLKALQEQLEKLNKKLSEEQLNSSSSKKKAAMYKKRLREEKRNEQRKHNSADYASNYVVGSGEASSDDDLNLSKQFLKNKNHQIMPVDEEMSTSRASGSVLAIDGVFSANFRRVLTTFPPTLAYKIVEDVANIIDSHLPTTTCSNINTEGVGLVESDSPKLANSSGFNDDSGSYYSEGFGVNDSSRERPSLQRVNKASSKIEHLNFRRITPYETKQSHKEFMLRNKAELRQNRRLKRLLERTDVLSPVTINALTKGMNNYVNVKPKDGELVDSNKLNSAKKKTDVFAFQTSRKSKVQTSHYVPRRVKRNSKLRSLTLLSSDNERHTRKHDSPKQLESMSYLQAPIISQKQQQQQVKNRMMSSNSSIMNYKQSSQYWGSLTQKPRKGDEMSQIRGDGAPLRKLSTVFQQPSGGNVASFRENFSTLLVDKYTSPRNSTTHKKRLKEFRIHPTQSSYNHGVMSYFKSQATPLYNLRNRYSDDDNDSAEIKFSVPVYDRHKSAPSFEIKQFVPAPVPSYPLQYTKNGSLLDKKSRNSSSPSLSSTQHTYSSAGREF